MTNNLHRTVQINRGKENFDGPIHELTTTVLAIHNHDLDKQNLTTIFARIDY